MRAGDRLKKTAWWTLLALGCGLPPLEAAEPAADAHAFSGFLDTYCAACHNDEDWAGGIAFDALTPEPVGANAKTWEAVARKLRGRLMPPPGKTRPDAGTLADFVSTLESSLDRNAAGGSDPGYVVLHRLNRVEYANAIEDVLAMRIDPAEYLPKDPEQEGLTNIAASLQVTPTFLEQYIAAARAITQQAVGEAAPKPALEVRTALEGINGTVHIEGLPLGTRGGLLIDYNFPADGEYVFKINILSEDGYDLRSHWLEYPNTLILTVDGKRVFRAGLGGEADLRATDQQLTPAVAAILGRFADIHIPIKAGPHKIGVTWVAKTFAASDVRLQQFIAGEGVESVPRIKSVEFAGPYHPTGAGDTPSRRRIFSCVPRSSAENVPCARSILASLGRIAYRRSLSEADLVPLLQFFDTGLREGGFETGIQKALMAMLVSPSFLFRAEEAPVRPVTSGSYRVSDIELASRLSFFLWSRGPDSQLLDLAEKNELHSPEVLAGQLRRMLADPRSRSLVTHFAFQWLHMGSLDLVEPNPRLFPQFDAKLREAFGREVELFVDSILRGDRSILELLSGDHTFVNERLARHYGIKGIRGEQFQRVRLEDPNRWGLLGKAGVLMSTSYPDRTSPVLRGTWILENILGAPPAAPPPNVEAFPETKDGEAVLTVRRRLEGHRQNSSCNACHGVIDPLGLSLENFDAIGAWRDRDRLAGEVIDASGQLADGTPLNGPLQLRAALLAHPEQFVQTFTEKLFAYATGRTIEYSDMPTVRAIVREAQQRDFRFGALVEAIVNSPSFQMKKLPAQGEPVPVRQASAAR